MKRHTIPKLLMLLALAAPAWVQAQAQRNVHGTIDEVMLDEQYIVIDGKRLVVRGSEVVVTYKGEPVDIVLLTEGLTAMYNTRADGSISEITLIGPTAVLEAFKQH